LEGFEAEDCFWSLYNNEKQHEEYKESKRTIVKAAFVALIFGLGFSTFGTGGGRATV